MSDVIGIKYPPIPTVIPCSLSVKPLVISELVALGMFIATTQSLFVVLVIDTVGMELYEAGITVCCVIISFAGVAFGPLIGEACLDRKNLLPLTSLGLNFHYYDLDDYFSSISFQALYLSLNFSQSRSLKSGQSQPKPI